MSDTSTPETDAEALACRHFYNQPIDYVPLCVARKLESPHGRRSRFNTIKNENG